MKETILKIIHSGESETVEFKENFNMEAFETVSAFSNTKGGTILIGVSDKGKIHGVQPSESTLRDWSNRISQSIDPKVVVTINTTRIEERGLSSLMWMKAGLNRLVVKGGISRGSVLRIVG